MLGLKLKVDFPPVATKFCVSLNFNFLEFLCVYNLTWRSNVAPPFFFALFYIWWLCYLFFVCFWWWWVEEGWVSVRVRGSI